MPIEIGAITGIANTTINVAKIAKGIFPNTIESFQDKIEQHIRMIEVWSDRIQILGMSSPVPTRSSTIPLILGSSPRTYYSNSRKKTVKESEIISEQKNYIVLGDPGSGKTTTVKRLIRKIIFESPASTQDITNFPILIIARELSNGQSIINNIADILGLNYTFSKRDTIRDVVSPDDENVEDNYQSGEFYYDNKRLWNVINEFLNKSCAAVFVDGLDELQPAHRRKVESELVRIARGDQVKIVATCRSGEFGQFQMEGFSVVEIEPLTSSDVMSIVNLWAEDPVLFNNELSIAPYKDAADRPLFLIQLILVFNMLKRLPQRPSDVYYRIIIVCLEIWDRERRVIRTSGYGGFTSERKLEFLAALSFTLTYTIKSKSFSGAELQHAYSLIRHQFMLPEGESAAVCKEIESHTGLLFESYGHFEFSHLSLQEYLCAYHMVRLPFDPLMVRYLIEYPAPVAVAVSISSDPSSWLSALVYHAKNFTDEVGIKRDESVWIKESEIISLLGRLVNENVTFKCGFVFGLAVLRLIGAINSIYFLYKANWSNEDAIKTPGFSTYSIDIFQSFLRVDGIMESIEGAFQSYFFDPAENVRQNNDYFIMHRVEGKYTDYFRRLPEEIDVKKSVIRYFEKFHNMEFLWCTAEDTIVKKELPF